MGEKRDGPEVWDTGVTGDGLVTLVTVEFVRFRI